MEFVVYSFLKRNTGRQQQDRSDGGPAMVWDAFSDIFWLLVSVKLNINYYQQCLIDYLGPQFL